MCYKVVRTRLSSKTINLVSGVKGLLRHRTVPSPALGLASPQEWLTPFLQVTQV